MKLIAETKDEETILDGTVLLLREIGVEAKGFRQEDVVAVTHWDLDTFNSVFGSLLPDFDAPARKNLLLAMEDPLRMAMVSAGFDFLLSAVEQISETIREKGADRLCLSHNQQ